MQLVLSCCSWWSLLELLALVSLVGVVSFFLEMDSSVRISSSRVKFMFVNVIVGSWGQRGRYKSFQVSSGML